jgi:hypothetical protein
MSLIHEPGLAGLHDHGFRRSMVAIRLLVLSLILAASGCTGIVVGPENEELTMGVATFWGYALEPGQVVHLEAQNTSNGWESVAQSTSVTAPTYTTSSLGGYYFTIDLDPKTLPSRFHRTAPFPQNGRVHFRVKSAGLNPAETRKRESNTVPPTAEWTLASWWATYKGDGILRIDFRK